MPGHGPQGGNRKKDESRNKRFGPTPNSANPPMQSAPRLQSALEYLSTYGWAILIIAVVLTILASLGAFNSSTIGTKAQPGSCQIYRPGGPGTTVPSITTRGLCNLPPEFVAQLDGAASYINLGSNSLPIGNINSAVTVSGWVKINSQSDIYDYLFSNARDCCGSYNGYDLFVSSGYPRFDVWNSAQHITVGSLLQANKWYFLTGVYDGSYVWLYVNGVRSSSLAYSGGIGIPSSFSNYLGALAIGDAPISPKRQSGKYPNLQHLHLCCRGAGALQGRYWRGTNPAANLVGWWPLNGDTNDYSSNENIGAPTSITYSSTWQSGYTHP